MDFASGEKTAPTRHSAAGLKGMYGDFFDKGYYTCKHYHLISGKRYGTHAGATVLRRAVFARVCKKERTMAIIDAHAHIYPAKIAQRATDSVKGFYGFDFPMFGNGTVADLTSASPEITHYVVHSVAVRPHNVASINDFIAAECAKDSRLIGLMAAHQNLSDPEAEINRAIGMGLKGIKLHPDTQQVNADDPRLMNIYEIAQAKGLPVILHAGDYRYDYSHPRRIKKVLRAFPDLRVNAAHFGGWSVFALAVEYLQDENCFMDLSSAYEFLGLRRSRELIDLYGTDRLMFGSDYPSWDPQQELDRTRALRYGLEDFQKLTWHNAERFLGITVE